MGPTSLEQEVAVLSGWQGQLLTENLWSPLSSQHLQGWQSSPFCGIAQISDSGQEGVTPLASFAALQGLVTSLEPGMGNTVGYCLPLPSLLLRLISFLPHNWPGWALRGSGAHICPSPSHSFPVFPWDVKCPGLPSPSSRRAHCPQGKEGLISFLPHVRAGRICLATLGGTS